MVNAPSFDDIELRRSAARITRVALCERAGIDRDTYRRTAKGTTHPNSRTLRKWHEALNELIEEHVQRLIREGSSL